MGRASNEDTGWTLETLQFHFAALFEEREVRYQQRFDAQTKAIEAALLAAKEAVVKAELSTEKRFEGVNEFRQTLSDQAAQFMTRVESEATTDRNAERIQELANRINRSEGRGAGLNAGWAYLVAALSAVGTVTAIILALRH